MLLQKLVRLLDPGSDRLARLSRLYALASVPALAVVLLVMGWPQADGHHDVAGATLGHDLSHIWVAGRTVLAGRPAEIYDIPLYHQRLVAAFGPDAALFAWHYPPVYMFVAAGLAMMSLPAAMLAWAMGSVLLIAGALRAILGAWKYVLVGLAFPSLFECLAYGQNGLLSASLLAFGLVLAERRPVCAGLILGLLCYKPQLACLAPMLMLATGRWRVAAASCASALMLIAASVWCFGTTTWIVFVQSLPETNTVIFQEAWGSLALNASTFGAVRLFGGTTGLAWLTQIGGAAIACGTTLWLWRRPATQSMRHAALLAAVPLVSPYVPVYDLAILLPAGAFFIRSASEQGGLLPAERLAIIALCLLALDPRGLTSATHLPCGWLLAAGAFLLIVTGAFRRLADVDPLRKPLAPWPDRSIG